MATPKLEIHLTTSRKPKHYRYKMIGKNGELMMYSELIENTTYIKSLMKRFEAMGFIIKNLTKLKLK